MQVCERDYHGSGQCDGGGGGGDDVVWYLIPPVGLRLSV